MQNNLKLLFVINPGSGDKDLNWPSMIDDFFSSLSHETKKIILEPDCRPELIKDSIKDFSPDRVVAVGGDGTVKLVAEALLDTDIALGILPAGSANGLAQELDIPLNPQQALLKLISDRTRRIHLVNIDDELCVHLSDIGFNAAMIKLFESGNQRGMLGYVRASWRMLWKHSIMQATINIDGKNKVYNAAMIVIANGTRYGSGAIINPLGRLDDELFEVVIIKKISFTEIFKMMFTHKPYDPNKTELLQTRSLEIRSRKKAHFQIDGEYIGKVRSVSASLLKDALCIIA